VTGAYTVDVERCIRCGGCAILAPATFAVDKRVRLVRQPASVEEERACATAALVCPAQAIGVAS
jgi:ferredoxin